MQQRQQQQHSLPSVYSSASAAPAAPGDTDSGPQPQLRPHDGLFVADVDVARAAVQAANSSSKGAVVEWAPWAAAAVGALIGGGAALSQTQKVSLLNSNANGTLPRSKRMHLLRFARGKIASGKVHCLCHTLESSSVERGTAAALCVQTKSLDEGLREAQAKLEAAEGQLTALGRSLGTGAPSDLQPALEARLAELKDASADLRDTRRRLQVTA